jgi:peptidoglycan glycosyltransferase
VNPQINRLFGAFAALFAALVGMSSYWLWKAPDLEARRGNPNLIVRQVTIKRGLIYAADGTTVFAANRRKKVQGRTWYLRRYPTRELVAQTVGYSTIQRSRAGLEQSLNDFLTASNSDLRTVVDRALGKLQGLTQEGNAVVTTIDADAQRVAMEQLAGRCGAAVALEPATGRMLVIASRPSYDPNLIERSFRRASRAPGAPCQPGAPLLNRATQGLFIPGSTFKVITAAAALDTGRFTPESEFDDPGYCLEYGKRVFNYSDQGTPRGYGRVDFATALENSINSVFCNIGKDLGPLPILEYARRFGFYEVPPLETPSDEREASGLRERGSLFLPDDPNEVDPGRLAFGQERMLVTPLQMAMVAAGVANGGVVMKPTVVDRVVAPDGAIITRTGPEELARAVAPRTAAELTTMMTRAVESGTGTAARIAGVSVAGKTGTAETGQAGKNDTWFICFAPADAPEVAVAVVLEDQAGTGGATAAPIAKEIIEALLGRNP